MGLTLTVAPTPLSLGDPLTKLISSYTSLRGLHLGPGIPQIKKLILFFVEKSASQKILKRQHGIPSACAMLVEMTTRAKENKRMVLFLQPK